MQLALSTMAAVGTRQRGTDPGERAFLDSYDPRAFPPVAVTVDVAILTVRQGQLSVLLVRRGTHPYRGRWALPGGFVAAQENLDAAAARELAEETGVGVPAHPFDHDQILADAVERARAKLEYTNLATWLLDEPFTVAELRRVYEAVWGVHLHQANFRRKVLATPGFVAPTGEAAATGRGWAELYTRGGSAHLHPALLRPA